MFSGTLVWYQGLIAVVVSWGDKMPIPDHCPIWLGTKDEKPGSTESPVSVAPVYIVRTDSLTEATKAQIEFRH